MSLNKNRYIVIIPKAFYGMNKIIGSFFK